jgi:hypothetical protein
MVFVSAIAGDRGRASGAYGQASPYGDVDPDRAGGRPAEGSSGAVSTADQVAETRIEAEFGIQ